MEATVAIREAPNTCLRGMPAGDADVPPRLKPELRMNWASMLALLVYLEYLE